MTQHIISTFFALVLLAILIGVLVLAFEIKMFIAAWKNPHLTEAERVIWCVAMLLIHPFVALAYYFIEHQNPRIGSR